MVATYLSSLFSEFERAHPLVRHLLRELHFLQHGGILVPSALKKVDVTHTFDSVLYAFCAQKSRECIKDRIIHCTSLYTYYQHWRRNESSTIIDQSIRTIYMAMSPTPIHPHTWSEFKWAYDRNTKVRIWEIKNQLGNWLDHTYSIATADDHWCSSFSPLICFCPLAQKNYFIPRVISDLLVNSTRLFGAGTLLKKCPSKPTCVSSAAHQRW